MQYDLAVIGGGIVGLATAYQYTRLQPGRSVVVLEKEPALAMHQTGRNSGVIHSGIYYKPGSAKALNCRQGKAALEDFCAQEGIPFDRCGKVIVAVDDSELPALRTLFERGQSNGVECVWIGTDRLRELEPHAAGVAAIHVPETGIVDYRQVCARLAERIEQFGGVIALGAKIVTITSEACGVTLDTTRGTFHARQVANCAGLHSDRIAGLAGAKIPARIIPFRGEYYDLLPAAHHLCRNLIYPTPDPRFPFLGVHFTRRVDGSKECGPNAVLACGREAYHRTSFHLQDTLDILGYRGFQHLARRHWRMGLGEFYRSLSKAAFVRALQRLIPAITAEHLTPAPAGIRAQAVQKDGKLVDDFMIAESERIMHVVNAPSPAATASLAIGETIARQLTQRMPR